MLLPQKSLLLQVSRLFPDGLFFLPTQERVVALTIDDVPTPGDADDRSTRQILDAIAVHNQSALHSARATFFIISSHLNSGSTVFQDALAQGHELANHGTADTTAALLYPNAFTAHFREAHDRITDRFQQPLRWYRPGRGLYNQAMLSHLQLTPGYESRFALASMIPFDTFRPTNDPTFTFWYLSQFVFPGAILLLHGGSAERSRQTAQVLSVLLRLLDEQGYEVVSLSELYDRCALSILKRREGDDEAGESKG
ncbi:polysaccharide deacetylase family protein [Pseudanabaena sp. FACHB-2040]|uniref:polysaccharide deacetylase family protein n=1 Tax=Pseudanabaena sp. FACHB-2040 TaxID=2692859 RepID=UPI001682EEF3|nr:polysaccharide deacetylase family protein [Pseudanabaena sp. FACHB-2040]MBD2257893.1 polysaccharide deacetylase family protein [Pseudanabaena sp. FACHB-2040]